MYIKGMYMYVYVYKRHPSKLWGAIAIAIAIAIIVCNICCSCSCSCCYTEYYPCMHRNRIPPPPLSLCMYTSPGLPVSLSSFLQVRLLYLAKDHSYEAQIPLIRSTPVWKFECSFESTEETHWIKIVCWSWRTPETHKWICDHEHLKTQRSAIWWKHKAWKVAIDKAQGTKINC